MIAAVLLKDYLPQIISILLGGGAVAIYTARKKVPAEAGALNVASAQKVLDMQQQALKQMEGENVRLAVKIAHLDAALAEFALRYEKVKAERDEYARKVAELEAEVHRLRSS